MDRALGRGAVPTSWGPWKPPGRDGLFSYFQRKHVQRFETWEAESRLVDSQACASGPLTSHPQGLGFLGSTVIGRVQWLKAPRQDTVKVNT